MTSLEEVFLKIGEEEEDIEEDTEEGVDDNCKWINLSFILNVHIELQYMTAQLTVRFATQNPALNTNESVVVMETEQSVFDPSTTHLNVRSNFSIWKALVLKQFLVYIRNSGLILFGFLFPIGLASLYFCFLFFSVVSLNCI